MQKQITQFKSTIQGVESTFLFDAACPINIAKEAVLEALKWLGQIEDTIKAQMEAKAAEEKPPEVAVETTQEVNNEQLS